MIIAYDGTHYSGWQIQPNGISIQELLQNAVKIMIKEDVSVIGSGRTDAGVHAMGQVAHFVSSSELDLHRFIRSVNGLLPKDIRVKCIEKVSLDFHARYSACSKIYHYNISIDSTENPFNLLYSWHLFKKIDVSLLQKAALLFVGRHDFSSFANESHRGCACHDAIRIIHRLDVIVEGNVIRLEFEGNGFLYKMVRNITGTLVEVASGKRPLESVPQLIAAKDRKKAGAAAPPHGLFLMHVGYRELKTFC